MSKSPTAHHKSLTKSSWALLIMIPIFLFTVGPEIGTGYESALETFSKPIPSLIAALTIVLTLWHLKLGIVSVFVDYMPGASGENWIKIVSLVCYVAMAASVISIATLLF